MDIPENSRISNNVRLTLKKPLSIIMGFQADTHICFILAVWKKIKALHNFANSSFERNPKSPPPPPKKKKKKKKKISEKQTKGFINNSYIESIQKKEMQNPYNKSSQKLTWE